MTAIPDPSHPSPQQLQAFSTGRLESDDADWIEQHLLHCATCLDLLQASDDHPVTTEEDPLLAALRRAHRAASDPLSAVDPADATSADEIPAALQDHPRYRIDRLLGNGGMGAVYLAEHRLLERPVVIKVIRPDLIHKPDLLERFFREARLAARLSHPNIVTVYEAEQIGGTVLLVMEYVAGRTFAELVKQRGTLPVPVAAELVRLAANGLQYMHQQQLVHRDVKPSNLIVTPTGEVKVLDLGLAFFKADAETASLELTLPEQGIGTVDYTPPEQWESSRDVDTRADVYSLGCTFYFLLTGRAPFAAADGVKPSLVRQLWSHSTAPVPDIRQVRADVPDAVADLLQQMLAKRPDDRTADPLSVAVALKSLNAEVDLAGYLAAERPDESSVGAQPLSGPSSFARRPRVDLPPSRVESRTPIKVGVLHSLTGTMAISERPVVDATLMAIDEINANGGVLGRQVQAVVADGASDEAGFAVAAEKLILTDRVVTVFGCWTSDSRRTVRPIFERHDHLLFYPVQYEGLEQSTNIIYTGAAPNQQILPAVRWCTTVLEKRRLFLVGSDYVFPRCANAIIRDYAATLGADVVGEAYLPLGGQDASEMMRQIADVRPDMILNTINGDSNVAFYRALRPLRSKPAELPVMSFSIAEEELRSLNARDVAGDYAAWNYFMSIDREQNHAFVKRFQDRYGAHRVLTDPMQAAYVGVNLWAKSVAAAGSDDVAAIRRCVGGQKFNAPGGVVTVDPITRHTLKSVRIGKIVDSSSFEVIYTSENPITPMPYPVTRTPDRWRQLLDDLHAGWGGHWASQPA
ncbi:MAG: serine/threonine protein kinase [Phycisphaerales bacterium]|nr:serine/threonine protein kinase [Phycisphaerales bacterium]